MQLFCRYADQAAAQFHWPALGKKRNKSGKMIKWSSCRAPGRVESSFHLPYLIKARGYRTRSCNQAFSNYPKHFPRRLPLSKVAAPRRHVPPPSLSAAPRSALAFRARHFFGATFLAVSIFFTASHAPLCAHLTDQTLPCWYCWLPCTARKGCHRAW